MRVEGQIIKKNERNAKRVKQLEEKKYAFEQVKSRICFVSAAENCDSLPTLLVALVRWPWPGTPNR